MQRTDPHPESAASSRGRRGPTLATREALWAWAFLALPLAFFLLLRIWPTLQAFWLSMFTWHVDPAQREFVGVRWYAQMLGEPRLRQALVNTFQYALIIVPAQLVLGIAVAMLLDSVQRWRSLFRALFFAPYVTPAAAVAWVWGWMYSVNFGVINNVLIEWSIFWEERGLPWLAVDPLPFLTDPATALPSVAAVVVWQQLGFQVVLFLAGLQGVPRSLYDAAAIDGASAPQRFRWITLPLLNPVIVFSVVLGTITTLQLFDQVVNINFTDQGGPLGSTMTLALYMYQEAFSRFRIGYAAAVTVLLFGIILIVTVIQLAVFSRGDEGEMS